MNADTDVREVRPSGVGTHEQGGALRILSAALAKVEVTACVESAGEAEKAITAKCEALEPMAYGKGGSRSEMVRPRIELGHCRKRVSTRAMDRKEDGQGAHTLRRPQREGHVRMWKDVRKQKESE